MIIKIFSFQEFQTIAYATADEFDLEKISEEFRKQGLYVSSPIIQTEKANDSTIAQTESAFKVSGKYSQLRKHFYHLSLDTTYPCVKGLRIFILPSGVS